MTLIENNSDITGPRAFCFLPVFSFIFSLIPPFFPHSLHLHTHTLLSKQEWLRCIGTQQCSGLNAMTQWSWVLPKCRWLCFMFIWQLCCVSKPQKGAVTAYKCVFGTTHSLLIITEASPLNCYPGSGDSSKPSPLCQQMSAEHGMPFPPVLTSTAPSLSGSHHSGENPAAALISALLHIALFSCSRLKRFPPYYWL